MSVATNTVKTPAKHSSNTKMMDFVSLSGSLKGERALEQLLAPSVVQDPDTELCLNAHAVESIDAVAATASHMRIQRHLREHPDGSVTIWLPHESAVAARFAAILNVASDRVLIDPPESRPPAHFSLLPTTPIADSEDARLIGEVVLDACLEARIARRRAGYITEAAMELADNAVRHAPNAPDPAVVAVSSVGRERIVEVAVTDAGSALSEASDPAAILRAIPGRAIAGERGFLGLVLNKGGVAGVDVTVRISAGSARLLWTPTQHRIESSTYVPGATVVARVGR